MRALLVVVMLCAVAAVPASAQSSVPAPIDPRLVVIGDSVILGAQPWIVAVMSARGWQVFQTSQESLHTWQAGAIIDENRSAGGLGRVVVVQLGTNDSSDPVQFGGWIDQLMAHLADVERVFWVNMRQFRPTVPAANAAIAAAATRHPSVRILDWDARATPDPTLVYGDGYHLNPAGQVAMAQMIADALDAYVLETVPTTTTLPPTTIPPTTATSVVTASTRVSRPGSDGVDVLTIVVALAGGLVAIGLVAMIATRSKRRAMG